MPFALFRRAGVDPTHLEVSHAGSTSQIALKRRPAGRRMSLRVSSANGAHALTFPERADLRSARRFANAHGGWIAARLARIPARIAFAHGAQVPFRGVPH